jgi:hypothetical protein
MKSKCIECQKEIVGRTDKRFCTINCKNNFNYRHRIETKKITKTVDGYLHRNREIIELLMGTSKKETFDRNVIVRTGFKFDYFTGIYTNKEGKMYRILYDYAWLDFSDQKILIVKKSIS